MNKTSKVKGVFEVLVVIGLILVIPLFFAIKTAADKQEAKNTPMPLTLTAMATFESNAVTTAKQPPACAFPLAQTTTAEAVPEEYIFSEPQVALTSPVNLDIVEWLPDNRQVLLMRDIPGKGQQSIEIFDSQIGDTQVYAIRTALSDAPPSWASELSAVVYPDMNILKNDKANSHSSTTRQVWVSQGNPADVRLIADNLAQFYVAVKPGGRQMSYLSDKQLSKRNASIASLPSLPSLPFDLTQWSVPLASFQATWRPGTSQIFLYNTSYVPSIPGYTFLLDVDSGQICDLDLGSNAYGRNWAGVGRWSPNGRYLAVVRASGTLPLNYSDLAVLDTVTGNLYTIDVASQEEKGHHFVKDIAWAPDNQHLTVIAGVFSDENRHSGLYLVDFISGQSLHLFPTYKFSEGWWGTNMAWSPDGSELLASCPNKEGEQLCLVNVQKNTQP